MFRLNRSSRTAAGVISALFIFVLATETRAQIQWRPISPAELQMTKPLVEPNADAEALIWETRIDDSDRRKLTMKNYVRVKIFNERGRERFSKFDIPYIKGYTEIKNIAAHVINPDGSTVELASSDIFEREIIKASKLKIRSWSFAVPNIAPGVIVEYQYEEQIKYGGLEGTKLQLQKDIPVQELTYLVKPYAGFKLTAKYYNTSVGGDGFTDDRDGFYRLTRRNVPGFKEESYLPPEAMVRPYIVLAQQSSSFSFDLSSPELYWRHFAIPKTEMVRALHKKRSDLAELTQRLIAGAAAPEERLRRIYEFCQQNVHNTSYEPSASTSDETWGDVFKENWKDLIKTGKASGSSAAIDVLFGAMATAAGFDTRMVYASRRDEIFMNPKMTDASLLRFAGIGIDLGGKKFLYDPGNKFAPFGTLPWFREDAVGFFVAEDGFAWAKIPLTPADKNLTKRTAKLTLDADGSVSGTVTIEYYGAAALEERMDSWDDEPAIREKAIKQSVTDLINNAEVTGVAIENFDDNAKPLTYKYSIKVPNYAQKTGKRVFFQPGFFKHGTQAAFSSPTRVHDIFFKYPWEEKDLIEWQFPAEFAASPSTTPIEARDNDGATGVMIEIKADPTGSKLVYSRDRYVAKDGKVVFKAADYPVIKDLWDRIQKAETETFVLTQK